VTYRNLTLEQPEAGVFLLTVCRPKALNALNSATLDELAHAVAHVAADDAARVLLVTGAGEKAFVAGADVAEMRDFSPREARAFSEKGMRAMRALEAARILSHDDRITLRDAYRFLRRAIDALRMVRGDARDLTVPAADSEEFQFLARRLGYGDRVQDLQADLERHTANVLELSKLLDKLPAG